MAQVLPLAVIGMPSPEFPAKRIATLASFVIGWYGIGRKAGSLTNKLLYSWISNSMLSSDMQVSQSDGKRTQH